MAPSSPDTVYFEIMAALAAMKTDRHLCRHMDRIMQTAISDPAPYGDGFVVATASLDIEAGRARDAELHAAGRTVARPLVEAAHATVRGWQRNYKDVVLGPLVGHLKSARDLLDCGDYDHKHRRTVARELEAARDLCATLVDSRFSAGLSAMLATHAQEAADRLDSRFPAPEPATAAKADERPDTSDRRGALGEIIGLLDRVARVNSGRATRILRKTGRARVPSHIDPGRFEAVRRACLSVLGGAD